MSAKISEKDLKAMKLHESFDFDESCFCITVTRVYNGWIYTSFHLGEGVLATTFVPAHDTRHSIPLRISDVT